jgi:hypothetical protein
VLLAGLLALIVASALLPQAARAAAAPQVIVAVADTGVNPYHEVYYRPQNTAHPCTWVAGFDDCSIPALHLSIGTHDTVFEAMNADREVWESVVPGQWYWIPKTNIIGAVCDRPWADVQQPDAGSTCIFDDHGHGTGTTSSVLSESPDALLLVHEGGTDAASMWTAPVVADIRTHSWGGAVPLPMHATDPVAPGNDACADEFEPETLYFVSAGNNTPMPTIADCYKSAPRFQIVGGGFPGKGHVQSWTTYDFASWFCRPTAAHDSITGTVPSYCGTSFSAPTAAGTAAAALLRIRQHDGYAGRSTAQKVSTSVTQDQFVDALRNAATYTPKAKFATPTALFDSGGWYPLPEQAPWLVWGYGWLDSTVTDTVVACALGGACPSKPAESQQYNETRQEARAATRRDLVPPVMPANDAGSGRDAGELRRSAVAIGTGRIYDARMNAYGFSGDNLDRYLFNARAGQRLYIAMDVPLACWALRKPNGQYLGGQCLTDPTAAAPTTVPLDGRYVLDVMPVVPAPFDYRFSIGLDAPAARLH